MTSSVSRLRAPAGAAALLLALASSAQAQYRPRPMTNGSNAAVGEQFHIEFAADFWNPTADLTVASSGGGSLSGIPGSEINAKRDLGLSDKGLPQMRLTLRPAKRHKFRFDYLPIKYEQSATLQVNIDFNGQRYPIGVPVNSSLDWKAVRMIYEFDFISKPRGFGGFIIEAKYTDVRVDLESPFIAEFARARAPIPALGGIFRVYPVKNFSITGEVTGFKIPDSIDDRYHAHYVDADFFGTFNLTNNVGIHGGYRILDLGYLIKQDSGSFKLNGIYFGGVVRY